MNPTLYNPATGMKATPISGVTADQQNAAIGQGFSQTITPVNPPSPISVDGLNTPVPNPIPQPTTTSPSNPPIIPAPAGTQVDVNGTAVNPQPAPSTEKTPYQKALEKLSGFGEAIGLKSSATAQAQTETNLFQKRDQATTDYNAYNQAKLALQQEVDKIYERGGSQDGIRDVVNDTLRKGNANLANLAVIAQSSQGLYSAAQATIKDKIDAQFQPIQDQIDFYSKYITAVGNDLTESDKFKLTEVQNQKKTDLASLTKTADDLHQNMLQNSAPASVYSALDKITNDYVSGKITATDAQSKMYQVAGNYGMDKTKVLQMQKLEADIEKAKADTKLALNTLPGPVQTRVQGIAGQFDSEQAVRNYQTIAETVDAVRNAGNSPTDDIQRIYAVAKVFDPNSAVREGEYKTVQDYATSLLQRAGLKINRVFNNDGFLTTEARDFINSSLANRLSSSEKAYRNIYDEYGRRIDKVTGHTDGTQYITDYGKAFGHTSISSPSIQINGLQVTTPEGVMTFPNQESLNRYKKDKNL